MATVTGGSGADPPDPGRGNEGRRNPKDKPIMQKPVPKRRSDSQHRRSKEPVRSASSGRTSSRPSLRPRQSARSSGEQLSGCEQEATEEDDDDWNSLQSSGFLHRSNRNSPHRSDSGVSSIHSDERRRDAERIARGEPSPVISRANSMEASSGFRRSRLSVQTTFPRQSSSFLSGILEQSPNTLGSAGARQDHEDSFTSQQSESYLESLSPTSLRRRPRTSQVETPFRSGRPLPPAGRRLSGPDASEQAQTTSPLDTATQGWVLNPLRRRDSMRAGHERYVPHNLDIQAVSGSAFEYIEDRRPYQWLGEDQQVYDDDIADPEPSLPIRSRRAGGRGSDEMVATADPTIMPTIDSTIVFSNSMPPTVPAANARSGEQARAEEDIGRCSRRIDSSDQIRQRPTSGSPVPRRSQSREAGAASQNRSRRSVRGSEAPRVPTRADSNSPSEVRPIFEMSDRQRSEWKSKGIDPKYLFKGT